MLAVAYAPSRKTGATRLTGIIAREAVREIWRRVMNWLMEPIPFPGQWPVTDLRREEYNRVNKNVAYDRRTP
jgi:hypothetical protein